MKSCLQGNEMEKYSTHNKEKSVVAEKFIRTLKNRIYKYMTSVSKNIYIDKLVDTVNKYSNTYHSTSEKKSVDVIQAHILTLIKKIITKILNLMLMIM